MTDKKSVPARPGSSSFPVLKTVEWCTKHGLKPVPLNVNSKAALDERYKHPDYKSPDISEWKTRELGVGLATGPMHGEVFDVDLDCEEAVQLAPFFLPKTQAVFGRASKPKSHYLYLADLPDLARLDLKDVNANATMVELRGGPGMQTVLPGSVHDKTLEPIEWADAAYPDVTRVDGESLIFAVKKIALGVLVLRYCWDEGFHNEPIKLISGMLAQYEWSEDEAVDFFEAIMSVGGGEDKSRIPTIRLTYRRFQGEKKVAGSGKLRKALGTKGDVVVDNMMNLLGSSTVNIINEYNERFSCVMLGGKFRIAKQDHKGRIDWIDKENFIARYETEKSGIKDGRGADIPKPKVWLKSDRRNVFDSVDFMPGVEDHPTVFNLWTGWKVAPDPDHSKCAAWLELLRDYICGGDEGLDHWMRCWFGHILREPMMKPRTCPVLVGVEGAGKTFLVSYFGKILDPYFLSVTQERHVTGNFNEHLATCLLLQSEEAIFAGDHKGAAIMRSLITDENQMLEKKGVDARMVSQFVRLILTSNKFKAAYAQTGDRRFTMIDMQERKLPDRLKAKLDFEQHNGGPAALMHYFLTMPDYDRNVPTTNYKTEEHGSLILENLDPIPLWWYSVLMSGQLLPPYAEDHIIKDDDLDTWSSVVASTTLFASCVTWLSENGKRASHITQPGFTHELQKMAGFRRVTGQYRFPPLMDDKLPRAFLSLPAKPYTIKNLPDLAHCRAAFEKYVGSRLDWPQESEASDRNERLREQMARDAIETNRHFLRTQEKE